MKGYRTKSNREGGKGRRPVCQARVAQKRRRLSWSLRWQRRYESWKKSGRGAASDCGEAVRRGAGDDGYEIVGNYGIAFAERTV